MVFKSTICKPKLSRSERWLFATPLLIVLALGFVKLLSKITGYYYPEKLVGHSDSIYAVKFSPDGKLLATGSDDGTIRVWDVQSKVATYAINWPSWWSNIDFSSDGKIFATGGRNKNITLWDAETGQPIKSWTAHNAGVQSVFFSPAHPIIASSGWDGSIKVWNKDTGHVVKTLVAERKGTAMGPPFGTFFLRKPLALSPQGDLLAFSGVVSRKGKAQPIIRLYDTETFEMVRTLLIPDSENEIFTFAFSPDGKDLAVCVDSILILNIASQQIICKMEKGNGGLKFSPNGRYLIGTNFGSESTVDVFDLETRSLMRSLSSDNIGTNHRIDISPDGRTLAFGDYSETGNTKVELWKIGD